LFFSVNSRRNARERHRGARGFFQRWIMMTLMMAKKILAKTAVTTVATVMLRIVLTTMSLPRRLTSLAKMLETLPARWACAGRDTITNSSWIKLLAVKLVDCLRRLIQIEIFPIFGLKLL
jgi:hypothetical protein